MEIFNVSIDLSKIDKSKIVSTDKNGQPFKNGAKYANLSIIVNQEPDKYGNHMSISLSQSQEERAAKEPRVYVGNGKKFESKGGMKPNSNFNNEPPISNDDDSRLPF